MLLPEDYAGDDDEDGVDGDNDEVPHGNHDHDDHGNDEDDFHDCYGWNRMDENHTLMMPTGMMIIETCGTNMTAVLRGVPCLRKFHLIIVERI